MDFINIKEKKIKLFKPEIYKYYQEYKFNETKSKQKILDLQFNKLKNIINYSYEFVPFYRNLWDEYGQNIDIKDFADLEKFPLVNKNMMQKALLNNSAIAKKYLKSKSLIRLQTTGSSGTPFIFPLNKNAFYEREGVKLAINEWFGYGIEKKRVRLWRGVINKPNLYERFRAKLNKVYTLCIYDPNEPVATVLNEKRAKYFIRELNKIKPDIIDGYVSALLFLSKYIIEKNIDLSFQPESIVTGAEVLSDEARSKIQVAFKTRVYNRYGGTETSTIAHECIEESKNNHYLHIRSDRMYVECIKNGKSVFDTEGEVTFTDFTNKAMPFIRFQVGDIAIISNKYKSKSNLPFPVIKKIQGRINDYFVLQNGSLISSHLWHNYFRAYELIDEFQVRQKTIDYVIVTYTVNKQYYDNSLFEELKTKVKKALPGCVVKWKEVNRIPVGPGGKFRHSISNIKFDLNNLR